VIGTNATAPQNGGGNRRECKVIFRKSASIIAECRSWVKLGADGPETPIPRCLINGYPRTRSTDQFRADRFSSRRGKVRRNAIIYGNLRVIAYLMFWLMLWTVTINSLV
jgi:hypothetical protein